MDDQKEKLPDTTTSGEQFCPSCGRKNLIGNFCTGCGRKMLENCNC